MKEREREKAFFVSESLPVNYRHNGQHCADKALKRFQAFSRHYFLTPSLIFAFLIFRNLLFSFDFPFLHLKTAKKKPVASSLLTGYKDFVVVSSSLFFFFSFTTLLLPLFPLAFPKETTLETANITPFNFQNYIKFVDLLIVRL